MELIFVKRSGKFDDLTIVRDAGERETISCPKQGIIPHDMVHYAVESVLPYREFLSVVEDGKPAEFGTEGGIAKRQSSDWLKCFKPNYGAVVFQPQTWSSLTSMPAKPGGTALPRTRTRMSRQSDTAWTNLAASGRLSLSTKL